MTWSKIVDAFKRLDDRVSDAVYLHGSYLTGQETIVRHRHQDEDRDHLQDKSGDYGVPVPHIPRLDGRRDDRRGFVIH